MPRKHYKSMNVAEITLAQQIVRANINFNFTNHARREMGLDHITVFNVLNALQNGRVIEVNNDSLTPKGEVDIRVVIECVIVWRKVVVVVGLVSRNVITVWQNAMNDHHATLDWANYTWETNLLTELAGFANGKGM